MARPCNTCYAPEAMNIKEAAALVGKSTDTVYRWKRAGINISDTAELLKYSAEQDAKACGRSFELALTRNGSSVNGASGTFVPRPSSSGPSTSGAFAPPSVGNPTESNGGLEVGRVGNPTEFDESDVWIDLPAPFPLEDARQALALLGSMKADCARRLAGCKLSVELAQEDLDRITEALRLTELTASGYDQDQL